MFNKLFAAAVLSAFCSLAGAQETIVVYFQKGFYPAEDKAVDELVAKFQKKTGVKVELSRYAPQEMIPKTVAALASRRASITSTCPGGQASIASRCGWPRPSNEPRRSRSSRAGM